MRYFELLDTQHFFLMSHTYKYITRIYFIIWKNIPYPYIGAKFTQVTLIKGIHYPTLQEKWVIATSEKCSYMLIYCC